MFENIQNKKMKTKLTSYQVILKRDHGFRITYFTKIFNF